MIEKTQIYTGEQYLSILKRFAKYAASNNKPGPISGIGEPTRKRPGAMTYAVMMKVTHNQSGKSFSIIRTIDEKLAATIVDEFKSSLVDEMTATMVESVLDIPSETKKLERFMQNMHGAGVIKQMPKLAATTEYLTYDKFTTLSEIYNVDRSQGSTSETSSLENKQPSADEQSASSSPESG